METTLNRDFLARAYRSTLVLGTLAAPFLLVYTGSRTALGVLAGAGLGLLNLRLVEELVIHWLRPEGAKVGRVVLAVALKLALVYGAGYLLLSRGWVQPAAMAAGFPAVLAVIFLKSLGRLYLTRAGVEPWTTRAGREEGKDGR